MRPLPKIGEWNKAVLEGGEIRKGKVLAWHIWKSYRAGRKDWLGDPLVTKKKTASCKDVAARRRLKKSGDMEGEVWRKGEGEVLKVVRSCSRRWKKGVAEEAT